MRLKDNCSIQDPTINVNVEHRLCGIHAQVWGAEGVRCVSLSVACESCWRGLFAWVCEVCEFYGGVCACMCV